MDRERNKTPEFLKRNKNYSTNKNEEKFFDFSSKMEIELSMEEENTKSSFNNLNNIDYKKVSLKKKPKKIKENGKEKDPAPDIILKESNEKCCSEIKENCLVF
jgi:hypothetical protein